MALRRVLTHAVVMGGLLAAFAWFILRPHEPLYQGKPLSFWLNKGFANGGYPQEGTRMKAESAIRELGPKALPMLIKMAGTDYSVARGMVEGLARNPHFAFLHLPPQQNRSEMAFWAFGLLGPRAEPAVPALIKLLHADDGWVRADAAYCLGNIGPTAQTAIPALLAALEHPNTNSNPQQDAAFRRCAFGAISEMGPAARSALPRLAAYTNDLAAELAVRKIKGESLQPFIEGLNDTSDWRKWSERAWLVGQLRTNADPAIPLLLASLGGSNQTVQRTALGVLGGIHRQPEKCVPAVTAFLKSTNLSVRQTSIYAIGQFGRAAKPAVPDVLRCLNDPNQWVQMEATNALRAIDPETANKILGPPTN